MFDRERSLKWLERALVLLGAVCLTYYGYMTAEARQFQQERGAAFAALLREGGDATRPLVPGPAAVEHLDGEARVHDGSGSHTVGVMDGTVSAPVPGASHADVRSPAASDVMALLEIPRLKLSAPVLSGDDDATLNVAVGHLPDTPKPWEPGNSALAAHRDGLFRPLRHIRIGDEVRVRTLEGEFVYHVRETKVVTPDDLSVLKPTEQQTLTLITCYPFNFIGDAPKRFIVHAERVDTAP